MLVRGTVAMEAACPSGLRAPGLQSQGDPGFNRPLAGVVSPSPEFNSSAMLENGQLVCLLPVRIFNHVMFNLNYLFFVI